VNNPQCGRKPQTILFGSISTVADTSELQREAFNAAFAEHGLDWRWDPDDPLTPVVREAATAAHRAPGCRHYSLFDFRIDPDGRP
jgi:hypothetical protein